MKTLVKPDIVLGGYLAAMLAACAAVGIRVANTSGADAQASAGMYAFGDGLLFIAVFGGMGVIPTGLGLYFLRPYRWFWIALSGAAIAMAASGLIATSVYVLATRMSLPAESPLMVWAALSVMRMLLAPPLAAALVVSAVIAPGGPSRSAILVGAGTECMVAAYAVLHWFAGCCFI